MKINLQTIRSKKPCEDGWEKLLKSLNRTEADASEVSISHLLASNGISDTLWVIFKCVPDELEKKRNMLADFAESAVNHAEKVLPIFEKERSQDNRPKLAIEAAKKCIVLLRAAAGKAARAAARAAADAAGAAAWEAADAAGAAAGAAAGKAARAAAWAAWAAAGAAAGAAAWEAAWEAAKAAAWAAWAAADDAAAAAAEKAEKENQKQIILKYFGEAND